MSIMMYLLLPHAYNLDDSKLHGHFLHFQSMYTNKDVEGHNELDGSAGSRLQVGKLESLLKSSGWFRLSSVHPSIMSEVEETSTVANVPENADGCHWQIPYFILSFVLRCFPMHVHTTTSLRTRM